MADNLLVIVLDQMRADALLPWGSPLASVPNIEDLASRSVQFTNAFTNAPVCNPARQSMLTGLYPHEHGVVTNKSVPIRPLRSIGHLAAEAGIETVNIGSNGWRAASDDGFLVSRGTNEEWLESLSAETRDVWEAENSRLTRRTTGGPSPRSPHEYRGHHLAGIASEELRRLAGQEKRFLMWVNLPEPHPPFRPPRDLYEKRIKVAPGCLAKGATDQPAMARLAEDWAHLTDHEWAQLLAAYYGLLELADQFVGAILRTLEDTGLQENTAVIITGDHGEMAGEHGIMLKFNFREAAIRVPLVVSDPGRPPIVSDDFVESVDIFALACDLLGVDPPTGTAGRSPLGPEAGARDAVTARNGEDDMIRTKSWKLVRYNGHPGELFRVDTDPGERHNLIHDAGYADRVSELVGRLEAFAASGV